MTMGHMKMCASTFAYMLTPVDGKRVGPLLAYVRALAAINKIAILAGHSTMATQHQVGCVLRY